MAATNPLEKIDWEAEPAFWYCEPCGMDNNVGEACEECGREQGSGTVH